MLQFSALVLNVLLAMPALDTVDGTTTRTVAVAAENPHIVALARSRTMPSEHAPPQSQCSGWLGSAGGSECGLPLPHAQQLSSGLLYLVPPAEATASRPFRHHPERGSAYITHVQPGLALEPFQYLDALAHHICE